MLQAEFDRNYRAAKKVINSLELDLSNFTVLTELGSDCFMFSTIIPAMAGARKVFSWVKDSVYGSAVDLIGECKQYLKVLDLECEVVFRSSRSFSDISEADIVTNSGMLRPLDRNFLGYLRKDSVVPLMYEAWEFRESDVDLAYCLENNIPLAGTNENYQLLNVFNHVKPLALKLSLNAGYEILGNNIIVWSDDNFGMCAKEAFEENGASSVVLTTDYEVLNRHLSKTDFIFVADYDETRPYFGKNGIFEIDQVKKINPTVGFVHLYGQVDANMLLIRNVNVYPAFNGRAKTMSYTLAHVGPTPVINLLAGGFKVGQLLKQKRYDHPLVQIITK